MHIYSLSLSFLPVFSPFLPPPPPMCFSCTFTHKETHKQDQKWPAEYLWWLFFEQSYPFFQYISFRNIGRHLIVTNLLLGTKHNTNISHPFNSLENIMKCVKEVKSSNLGIRSLSSISSMSLVCLVPFHKKLILLKMAK